MSIDNYKDPIVSQWHKHPQIIENESHVVTNGMFALIGLPDIQHRVVIDGYVEIGAKDEIKAEDEFKVDYTNGYVFMHPSKEGETINVTKYASRGVSYYPASRVWTKLTDIGEISETLDDNLSKIDYVAGVVDEIDSTIDTVNTVKAGLDNSISEGGAVKTQLDDSIDRANLINNTLSNPMTGTIKQATDVNVELSNTVSVAETTNDTLLQTNAQAQTTKSELDSSISTGSTLKDDLDSNISIGTALDGSLNTTINKGNQLKIDLPPLVGDADTSKTNLETTINNANDKKTELDSSISTANTTKTELDTSITNANIINDQLSNPTSGTIKEAIDINNSLKDTILDSNNIKSELLTTIQNSIDTNKELETSIMQAIGTKDGLDSSIAEGTVLKDELNDIIAGTDFEQVVQDLSSLKQDQHNHNNKNVLDALSDIDGQLLYNGEPILTDLPDDIGYMLKKEYDKDNDGKVDMANDSERLGGIPADDYATKAYTDEQTSLITSDLDTYKHDLETHKARTAKYAHLAENIGLMNLSFEADNVEDGMNELKDEVDSKESPSGAQAKADRALNAAKKYTNEEVGKIANDLVAHKAESVYEGETHGLRIVDGKLEYFDGENWKQIAGGSGSQVPLGNVVDFTAEPGDGKVILRWKDPDDIVVDGIVISKWKGTKILRKIGSYPANENDGVLVVDSGVRNQYAVEGFVDTGLENDIEYFYMAFPYTTDGVYTSDVANRVSAIPTAQKIYGVRIDKNNSNPEARVTYIKDAIGFTPMRGSNGNFQWGSWKEVFESFEIRPVVLKNKEVQYYLDPNDFTKKEDGTNAVITGADGDVMIEFGKTLWWKWTDEGTTYTIEISDKEFDGAVKHAFEIEEGYNLVPYYALLLTQILFVIFFKSTDSQAALGRGRVDGAEGYAATGGTNTKGMFYGSEADEQMKFLGIEDYWGNKFWWIDGLVTDENYNLLIAKNNFNDNGVGYQSFNSGITENISGYIDSVQGGNDKGFIMKSKNGSETTYYADWGYLYSGRAARFGGFRTFGSSAGFAYLQLVNAASNAFAVIGARLFCASNGKIYIGAYLGTSASGKLRSISGTAEPTGNKTIGTFRAEAKANN